MSECPEDILSKDPKISSAIMFGRGRFHPGVIVTPVTEESVLPNDEDWLSRYRNAIWCLRSLYQRLMS